MGYFRFRRSIRILSYTETHKTHEEAHGEPPATKRSSLSLWLFLILGVLVLAQILWFAAASK